MYRDLAVLASSGWTPSASGGTTYRVLVPFDPDFSSVGYGYCLFVLIAKSDPKVDKTTISNAIQAIAAKLNACGDEADACRNAAQVDFEKQTNKFLDSASLAHGDARAPARKKIDDTISLALTPASAVLRDRAALDDLLGAGGAPLLAVSRTWLDAEKTHPLTGKTFAIIGKLSNVSFEQAKASIEAVGGKALAALSNDVDYVVQDNEPARRNDTTNSRRALKLDGKGLMTLLGKAKETAAEAELATAVVTLLTNHGTLFPEQVAEKRNQTDRPGARRMTPITSPGKIVHLTLDGKIIVERVSVLDDDLRIRVASASGPPATEQRVLDGTTTKDLVLSEGVTLYDILALSRSVIRTDRELGFAEIRAAVDRISLSTSMSPEDLSLLTSAYQQLKRLDAVIAKSFDLANRRSSQIAETPSGTLACLGAWLQLSDLNMATIGQISAYLEQLVAQKPIWEGKVADLAVVTSEAVTVTGPQPIPFQIGFTQKSWLFTYVTPVVGYAQIDSPDGWFSLFYLAAQIHFFPNPVDDPLWRHGAMDARRAYAIELGFAPNVSMFGPDSRYRGIDGLPPPFVAVALHPLPYTSLSLGCAFVDRKRTVLAGELPHFAPQFFLGLNVQVNVPDLIRQATKTDTSTTVDKTK
jgi:hypothetical protein